MANSPLLQIPQVAPSQTNKETTINDGFSILERSLNDIKEISLVDADVTLNLTDYTRAFLFKLDAETVTGRTLLVPASRRIFAVRNDGDHDIDVGVYGESGLIATIHSASMCVLFNDGVNVFLISDSAASGQVSAFLSLPDTPNSFTGHAGEAMVVNEAEDALDFGTITVAFKDLTDGPTSYTDKGGLTVRVKQNETGVEFGTTYDALSKLSDTPDSYEDNAGKMLVVKTEEDGIEFVDIPDGVIVETRIFTLANSGFEVGDFTNWIVPSTSGSVWTIGTSFGLLLPTDGSKFAYFNTGQGSEPVALAYEIDLTDQAYDDELDESPQLQIVISMGSVTSDEGYIEIEFYTDSGATLSTATSPSYTGTSTMIDRTFKADVPEGARNATVYLYAKHGDESQDADNITFAFDNLRSYLKVNVDQINYFTQLQDTPSTFADQAGKVLIVNPGETGLTFAAYPSVRDNFTQLQDTPADYSNATKKYVRVNAAGDALEFVKPTLLELNDAPSSYSGKSKRILRVNSGESAIEFAAVGLGDLSGVDLTTDPPTEGQTIVWDPTSPGRWVPHSLNPANLGDIGDVDLTTVAQTDGQGLVWLESESKWVPADVGGDEFPDLTGNSGKVLQVNGTEDGVVWVSATAASYPTLTDNAGKVLAVNSTEDDVEWVDNEAVTKLTINEQTGAYTLVLADAKDTYLSVNSSTAVTVTIPNNTTVAIPVGSLITGIAAGAGQVTFAGGSGVTIHSPETLKLRKQYSSFSLFKSGTDTWDLSGDLEASS